MSRTLSGASFLLVCLAGGSLAAAPFSTLEERMSQSEFKAAGLERLSPEELKSLNDWLRSHGLTADAPMAMRDGKPDFYPDQFKREAVETRIAGTFTETVYSAFYLPDTISDRSQGVCNTQAHHRKCIDYKNYI